MQTLRKKSSPGKYKHEPSRYMGEGVSFKAKLIGILEVADARGDRMCQDALSDLKMAIRAAGEHKQRIVINIALDGLRLRDEKTGDCLYHHPVHKISFIAQDMTDSRAFGYIFGSPDSGHRFFGIKTDKAASQVVGAMRDLFQAVFELRKKEGDTRHNMPPFGGTAFLMGTGSYVESIARQIKSDVLDHKPPKEGSSSSVRENGVSSGGGGGGGGAASTSRQDAIADLLDLEFEMNNLHSPAASKEDLFGSDPFGDSFTKAPAKGGAVVSLPPPPSVDGTGTHRRRAASSASSATASATSAASRYESTSVAAEVPSSTAAAASAAASAAPAPASAASASGSEEKHWFDQETEALFDESELVTPPPSAQSGGVPSVRLEQELMGLSAEQCNLDQFDVFTELDPLGTGRSKPYIHKKDFFQDLKNPPKKVLKDLVGENQPTDSSLFQASFEPDPFSEDPFDKTDPFSETHFNPSVSFSPNTVMQDPFESSSFADFSSFGTSPGKSSPQPPRERERDREREPPAKAPSPSPAPAPASAPILDPSLHGPLRVTLPPEKASPAPSLSTSSLSSSPRQRSRIKHQLHKQSSMGLVKLSSPKSSRGSRLSKQMTVDGFTPLGSSPTPLEELTSLRPSASPSPPVSGSASASGDRSEAEPGSTSFSRLSASSAELADIAPEPPPRPAPNAISIKPPPLPPKKQHTTTIYKPPPRPPYQDDHPHYDHIENYESSSSPTPHEDKAPPIPVPMRRPRYDEAPQRPRRPMAADSVDDGYLSPSPLLPPPLRRTAVSSGGAPPVSMGPTLPTTEAPPLPTKTSLDITLSQLSKTGFSDLAATLGMSPSQLSKMTLQELTKCLESVKQGDAANPCAGPGLGPGPGPSEAFSLRDSERSSYKTLNESVDEEPTFTAEFEDNFDASSINLPKQSSEPAQESLFDKYAVFRELLEQDNYENGPCERKSPCGSPTGKDAAKERDEDAPKSPLPSPAPSPVPVVIATPPATASAAAPVSVPVGQQNPSVDRYAALREISLCDEASSNKDDDEGDDDADGEDGEGDGDAERENDMDGYVPAENEASDKEDSLTEVPRNDEDQDLLTLSAQHSESTESPTNDTTTVKDTLSIMETTIMEEEGCAADDTTEAISAVQELSDIKIAPITERPLEEETSAHAHAHAGRLDQGPSNVVPSSPADARSIADPGSRVSEDAEPPLKEGVSPVEVWAKFDASRFEKPPSDEAASPWSSDGKEYSRGAPASWKDDSDREQVRGRRRRATRSAGQGQGQAWREDEESEEGPWEENGWSDRESLYDDGPAWYPEQRRSRRRKVSPWRRSKPSREPSPWDSADRVPEDDKWDAKRWAKPADVDDDDDDLMRAWKTRPKNRGSSWEEERRRVGVGVGSWEDVTPEYEEVRKRRPSPWSGEDRRSSRESMTWGDDERYQRRRYPGEGERERERDRDRHRGDRRWRPERDDEYRRRRDRDPDRERERDRDRDRDRYAWPRKSATGDYRPHRHYRDHSHDSPWDDEYSEQGEDSPHFGSGGSAGVGGSGRKWRWSRPGSGSSQAEGRRSHEPYGGADEYEHSGRRYRDRDRPTSGSVERRSRSRDDAFNSDNEHDYWPEHARSRTERETRYEQRSQTLQSWRSNRYRKSHRSPFEDDFTGEPKSQESSLELADGSKRSPLSSTSGTTTTAAAAATHNVKVFRTAKKDSQSESEEARSGRGRSSCGSSHRQSPFEDDFTTSEVCNSGNGRLMSASSDVSDQGQGQGQGQGRFGADERVGPGAGGLVTQVPRSADSGVFGSNSSMEQQHRNGRSIDDVFLPADTPTSATGPAPAPSPSPSPGAAPAAAPLATGAPLKSETRRSVRLSGDDKNLAGMKARLSSLRRTDSSSSLRKSDSINIFARSCDPFDDDDFFNGDSSEAQAGPAGPAGPAGQAGQAKPKGDPRTSGATASSTSVPASASGDHMKWTDAFESFNFQDEQ